WRNDESALLVEVSDTNATHRDLKTLSAIPPSVCARTTHRAEFSGAVGASEIRVDCQCSAWVDPSDTSTAIGDRSHSNRTECFRPPRAVRTVQTSTAEGHATRVARFQADSGRFRVRARVRALDPR